MCAVPFICVCVCVRACMSVPTCVTSGRAIMLDTGMTMITVCHALTRGDEGPGGCSLCHDKPRTRPVTPSTPQTPATTPHPRTHSHNRTLQTAAMCNRHVLNKLKISSNFQRAFCVASSTGRLWSKWNNWLFWC